MSDTGPASHTSASVELRDLGYFAAIARCGHLTSAARELGVAQPTLSHAMARLEQAVGMPLWHRRGSRRSPLRLTPAGDILLRRAHRALAEVQAIGVDLDALHGLQRGSLGLGCIPSLMAGLLPRVLARLHRDHPAIEVAVHTVRSEEWRHPIERGLLDAALVADLGPRSAPGYHTSPCGHQRFVAVLRVDHPLASQASSLPWTQLRDQPLLLVPAGTVSGDLVRDCCRRAGFTVSARLVLDSPEGLRELVRLGSGISVLPEGYVATGDPDLRCIPLTGPVLRRSIHLVHAGELADRPVLALLHHLLRADTRSG